MHRHKKLAVAAGIAALVAAGGSAFTAGGVTNAQADAFVGGTVHQTVHGADLDSVRYVTDEAGTAVHSVLLTFAAPLDPQQQKVSIRVNDGWGTYCSPDGIEDEQVSTTRFTCSGGNARIDRLDVTVDGDDAVHVPDQQLP